MGNILVTGNGFDLYHDLNTRYYDFVKFVEKCQNEMPEEIQKICRGNTFLKYFVALCKADNNWIDCEAEIRNVVLVLQKVINHNNMGIKSVINLEDVFAIDRYSAILGYLDKYITIIKAFL